MALADYKPPFKYPSPGDDNETVRAALTPKEKDALIETLETKVNELTHSLEATAKARDILRLELAQASKYRRLDCVRVAQKHVEYMGQGDLIGTAANIARFVETGSETKLNISAGTTSSL